MQKHGITLLAVGIFLFVWPGSERPAFGAGGETCPTAVSIPSLPFSDTGNTCSAFNDYDASCPYSAMAPDVVYSFTPSSDMEVNISLCGNSDYDTKLFVYENVCSGTAYACNDDTCRTPSYQFSAFVSNLTISLSAGNTYYFVVDGFSSECGSYTLAVTDVTDELNYTVISIEVPIVPITWLFSS